MATPAVNPIREGFHTLTPYILVPDAPKFMEFLKQAFGAKEMFRVPRPDGKIMHAEAKIGDSMIELADGNEQYPPSPTPMILYVHDADEVYQRAIQAGATSMFEPVDQPYGDREAFVKDLAGNHWYITTRRPSAHITDDTRDVTVCLSVRGASKMIDFLKNAFGAEEVLIAKSPDGAVQHARIRMGDSILALGEAHGEFQPMPCYLHLYVPNTDALYERALRAGATSIEAPTDKPYGDRSAGVKDPWGNRWFLATHIKDVPL